MMPTVLVPMADGTEEIEAVCIIDTLRRAEYEVTVASVEKTLQVTCSRGTKITADVSIKACADMNFDLIACPGGMPGALHLRDSDDLTSLLKAQATAGKWYAAICAAPVVVLQHHGLLAGKNATCFSSYASELINKDRVDQRVVVDGNLITSRGAGTAIEFALALISEISGPEKAGAVGKRMLATGYYTNSHGRCDDIATAR
ncbi:MAG: DJ-1/PfpI family protein [Anaerolineae bacterium]|nr:DJ-1/PfpI family protein [Anaerolineae bacterium]